MLHDTPGPVMSPFIVLVLLSLCAAEYSPPSDIERTKLLENDELFTAKQYRTLFGKTRARRGPSPSGIERMKLYDRDQLLTPKQYKEIFSHGDKVLRKRAASVIGYTWDNATVPYDLTDTTYTEDDKKKIQSVFTNLETHTCVRFVPRAEEVNYVKFINDTGCYSLLGMVDQGKQPLSLSDKGCRDYGTIHHELMHALGIIHEQQRPDRDDFVDIIWDNMDEDKKSQFDMAKEDEVDYHGVPYDFSSLMQYYFKSFSNNKKDTIVPIDEPNAKKYVGHVWTKPPSYGDIKHINKLYKCDKDCGEVKCSSAAFVDQNCECVTPYVFYNNECSGDETTGWCLMYKDKYMRK